MARWLESYEYRFNFTARVFVFEVAVISVIALLTVGFRSIQAAVANPVNSLRVE